MILAIGAVAVTEHAVIARLGPATGAQSADAGEPHETTPEVALNDNRGGAGSLREGVLTLRLRAGTGVWKPEGVSGRVLRIEAFGEEGAPLSVPAPLVRVPEGTVIDASVRNDLETPLRVGGFCERGGTTCMPLDVPAHETRSVRFTSGPAGTYHYWGSSSGMPLGFRAVEDTQLSGAFIVDPVNAPQDDRVLIITEWTSLTRQQLRQIAGATDPGAAFLALKPGVLMAVNGRAWPFTERLTYDVGQQVRWRVINLSTQVHPMHLHGFYFDVDSVGDGVRDTSYGPDQVPHVVTQLMQPGSTMTMRWLPERAGNWLFHCHVMLHVSPVLEVDGSPKAASAHHTPHDRSAGMTGMVVGITVRDPKRETARSPDRAAMPTRRLTLYMRSEPNRFGDEPALGFVSAEGSAPPDDGPVQVPGPLLVLKRGEPVEITLVNTLSESAAIHWHGMELESYYDGVHGWGRTGHQVTPLVDPGGSFVVRFTPPRTGTFMYHTHSHDNRQLTSGLYGAMLVIDPGETFDERSDHIVVIGRGGPQCDAPVVLNGRRDLQLAWTSATRHRLRLINITPNDVLVVALQTSKGPVMWRPLTKDGAPVPPERNRPVTASQVIAVGETYDFEYDAPAGRQNLWLEVRTPAGRWEMQGQVSVK
jgi:FtsP/CotA-like multicopper oxidase with cupredoxin domain